MAPLRALNLPILTHKVLQFLAANGILSVEDFLVHDLYTLAALTEQQTNSEVLKQAIAEILSYIDSQHSQWLNGAQLLENMQQAVHVLPTGCEGLDSLLGGGLLEGTLTELVGPSASGKTQICLRATSHIAYHSQAAVMYLDTCNSFSSKHIAQFLNVLAKSSFKSKDRQRDIERVMKGIFHYNVFDVYCMLDILYQIESSMHTQGKNERSRVHLIIVDSVSSVITPILSGSNLQGHSLMISLGVVLKKLALEYSVAVLGFTKEIDLEKERWHGYIKDYDGVILMECKIDTKLPYTDLPAMIRQQRQTLDEKIRELSNCHIVYSGIDIPKKEAGVPRKPIKVEDIPGLKEAGWTPDQWGYSRFRLLNTPSEGLPNRQALHAFMRSLCKAMTEHADSWPFKDPVDPHDVPDYYDIIKDPMDLKTMSKRLDSEQYYVTLDMFIADVKRMFTNARKYNAPETIYYKCANRLDSYFLAKLQAGTQANNRNQQ